MAAHSTASTEMGSSELAADRFARWPGLLSLTIGVLLGPVAALVNHGIIYIATSWACGHDMHATLHVIPALCFLAAVGGGLLARADWSRVGGGGQAPDASVRDRSRFLAVAGMATSAISALLILTQWLAIFIFGPCMRA